MTNKRYDGVHTHEKKHEERNRQSERKKIKPTTKIHKKYSHLPGDKCYRQKNQRQQIDKNLYTTIHQEVTVKTIQLKQDLSNL